MRKAKALNCKNILVVEREVLKELLEDEIGVPELGEDGQVEIKGKIYQWVGATTPSEQLWLIEGYTALKRVKKQGESRKEKYMRKAKVANGYVIVVEREILKELLEDGIGVPELGKDGKVEIDDAVYQWVGDKTPSEQLRGIKSYTANTRVKKQSEEWKEKYVKKAKMKKGHEIMVVEVNILKQLLGIS